MTIRGTEYNGVEVDMKTSSGKKTFRSEITCGKILHTG